MSLKSLHKIYRQIRKQDPRYDMGAYSMMEQALDFELKRRLKENPLQENRHIDGGALCHGVKDYLLQQYGPMAYTLLKHWGISKTGDFGEIVFHLAEFGVFSVTQEDKIEDFQDVFDFEEAFRKPYVPRNLSADISR